MFSRIYIMDVFSEGVCFAMISAAREGEELDNTRVFHQERKYVQ